LGPAQYEFQGGGCPCGCGEGKKKKGLFKKFFALFASKDEKAKEKAARLMEEFADSQLEKGQKEIDKSIEAIAAALDKVNSYEEATGAIADAVSKYDALGFANCIDNVRYVAQVLGERNG
jgi:phage gp29-like protein